MQLNSLPQIYEVIVSRFITEDVDLTSTFINLETISYKINQVVINNLHNTVSFSLYFTDMISQTEFLNKLPPNTFKYTLKGLIYTNDLPSNLELYING